MANTLFRESAIQWIKDNTTFDTTQETYPANVELFIQKYESVMKLRPGITGENISGLSQSFNADNIGLILKQYAKELIGDKYMGSDVKAFPFMDRWVY